MTQQSTLLRDSKTPEQVVLRFLRALEQQDHATVLALLAPDVCYSNVSLPSIRGGARVASLFKILLGRHTDFAVQIHNLAVNGDNVLTERTDLIQVGSMRVVFWVCGTFCVQNGRIVVWRDYFDWLAISRGLVRGVVGVLVPKWRVNLPQSVMSFEITHKPKG